MSRNNTTWTPEDYAAYQARISKIAKKGAVVEEPEKPVPTSTKLVVQPSTDEQKLNKMERAWLEQLRKKYPKVIPHGVTLKLADDTRYTPDFYVLDENGQIYLHETKGFMRDDARCKLMVAARQYSEMRFVLVTKEKGIWKQEEVKP